MDGNQENRSWTGPVLLAGAVGVAVWRSLSPESRDKVWRFVEAMAAEHERRKLAELAQAEQLFIPSKADLEIWPGIPEIPPVPLEPVVEAAPEERRFRDYVADYELPDPDDEVPENLALINPDRKWLEVIQHPSVVVILGKRGSGKSALGYRLLELIRYRLKPYVVGLPENSAKALPEWLGLVPTLDDLPHDSVALIDEAYLTYHARESMSEKNRLVSQLLNLSRQRNQTLVFVTQEARQLDKNITSVADVVVFKKPSALQIELERPELRPIARRAREAFTTVRGSSAPWGYAFSPDADFEGLLENQLPTFWTKQLSRAFASGRSGGDTNHPVPVNLNDKRVRAKQLRTAGHSYAVIARELGVSKSTVVNYLKGYPYSRPPRANTAPESHLT